MKYIIKRVVTLLATLFLISIITFGAFHIIPGDPALMMLGTEASEEQIEKTREELGINKPLITQYTDWIGGLFHGEFGQSIKYKKPVSQILKDKIPVTVFLGIIAIIIVLVMGILLGIYAAYKKNSRLNAVINFITMVGISIPKVFLGIIVIWVFGLVLHWFVPGRYVSYSDNFGQFLHFMIFPAICIALPETCILAKYVRSAVIEQQSEGYVRTARSKGNKERRILLVHILKNAMVSIVPLIGMMVGNILAGSVIVEQVFSIPGVGRLLITSVGARDFPLTQTIVLYIAVIVVVVNFLVDIIIQVIDPRIRIQR